MRQRVASFIWGILLLLGGILILLFNFGVFDALRPGLEYITAGIAALSGIGFLAYYAYDRSQWWPVLPGFTLISVGAVIYLGTRGGARGETLTSLLLFGIAAAFAIVYLADPKDWWVIIPSGILLIVGLTVLLSPRLSADVLNTLLFTGIGLVFFLVYLLGPTKREVWWALIPGTALIVSGLFIYVLTAGQEQFIAKLWPLVPILLGLLLLVREIAHMRPTTTLPIATPDKSTEEAAGQSTKPAAPPEPEVAVIDEESLNEPPATEPPSEEEKTS
ncbi:MAG: hypothetical protein J7M34_05605 [Anaerolineae bacterium]|nr:hypothetical protein [Anaerolineae bacterium]